MSARREPSVPPRIGGYEYSEHLGMGGFADVFRYTQQLPYRSVAVKVLLAGSLSDDVRERFRTEADLMARLSHHPSIVTIYHADVATDGRPFLVMEYCARPSLGKRYRTERMGVPEVLRIGVRLACAVETAHQAGILHRDIKPANVLVTDFGWPALTDFGIAATTGWSSAAAVGMSIPWSPPELLAENPVGGVQSDVYSLAATIYSLLAGRSPFEVPDARNNAADLIGRIEGAALATTGRSDVPASLQAVLARAMHRTPAGRFHSALALARALQQIEIELLLPPTALDLPLDVITDLRPPGMGPGAGDADDELEPANQATRLHPIQSVSPEGPAGDRAESLAGRADARFAPTDAPQPQRGQAELPAVRVPAPFPAPRTAPFPAPRTAPRTAPVRAPRPGQRGRVVAAAVASLVVVGALVGVVRAVSGSLGSDPGAAAVRTEPSGSGTPSAAPLLAVPAPTDLLGAVAVDGTAVFTWVNPEPLAGDRYLWGVAVAGTDTVMAVVDAPTVTITPEIPGTPVCLEVAIVRADRRASTEPALGCTS